MTAEIAILNRQAVALAADSAVTVNYPEGPKVYNSVSKLFTLSKFAPVGVMVYGVADLTGVPWETIIKTFRADLGLQRFSSLEQYAEELIRYINAHKLMFSPEQQEQQLMSSVFRQFRHILVQIDDQAKAHIALHGSISPQKTRGIVNSIIREEHDTWMQAKPLDGAPKNLSARLKRRWGPRMDEVRDFVFGTTPLGPTAQARLRDIGGQVFSVDLFPDAVSGIVVAGFGEDDFFPRLVSFDVEGVLLNYMKMRPSTTSEVGAGNSASIVPFAQRDMVDLFMRGVDPVVSLHIDRALEDFINSLPDALANQTGATGTVARRLRRQVRKESRQLRDNFLADIRTHITEHHIRPIVTAVESLPKEELASMAESLVSLTSFKRRVTQDPETVGGPIDVAVVSKGDGFVWINRKHYFRPELNHHFFANYFKEVDHA
jgi:hypothetical protein